MTTTQKQIAERLIQDAESFAIQKQAAAVHFIADLFKRGYFDDILGKPEPTIDDVREEARRVFGIDAATRFGVRDSFSGAVYELFVEASDPVFCVRIAVSGDDDDGRRCIASAYAALRVLPSEVTG